VLYARSVTFGAPFAKITALQPGDEIWAVTGQGRFLYRVTDVRRAGDPVPQQPAPGSSQLTLVTSESHGWRNGWAPTQAVYVDAVLAEPKTAAESPGHVQAVPDEESSMHGDTSSLIATVFWLQALLLAAIGIVWAWRRWGAWQTWIVGTVVVIALLWGASDSAVQLLPNLI
jgi:sortase A